jgi:nucleotide-binding universal stress UspA family protein
MSQDQHPLRILTCIGGGPEAFTGLKFVHRLSETSCADIVLLFVRPIDSGLKSGGLDISVARQNVLDWGIELPGMSHLKKARDILSELGELKETERNNWYHREVSGDPAGEFVREYRNGCGGLIGLHLRTASDVTSVVVEEAEKFDADIVVVGGSPEPVEGLRKFISYQSLALKIAAHTACSVIVARKLEPGYGHLICVQDNERVKAMLPKTIRHAHACACPISLLSVAKTEADIPSARKAVEEAAEQFRSEGIEPHELLVEQGDPVETIIEIGYDFSLIVMAESEKPWFAKAFSVVHDVVARARNSVMVVK